ncbi:14908_t:CDS:2 [Funneliformis geosporum]|uniref:Transmembrane protein 198 n=1 Tax=Funneliformis geosporum TaxID=1117311 RepID=A0A9W4SMB9_9GLOM|nr:14908_t:CDS:2 [Funneliformis geosporum]CAI2173511.1 1114_t:CDS:2 [Funneliformis geosporum]
MTPTLTTTASMTIRTAVLIPSNGSPNPTLSPTNAKVLYNVSPSYNVSYGEPAPFLKTRNSWQNVIYGIIFMTIGLIEIFFGYKLIRITLLLMGFLFWSSTSLVVLLILDNSQKYFRSALYYFVIWLSSGTLGGLLSFWCWHLGLILTSAYGGFAFIITSLTLIPISIDIIRYILISFFILLPPILVYKYERQSIYVATSVAGSYTFFCGLDEFAHQGYREMIQFTRYEGTLRFVPTTIIYIMILLSILLAALGITFEYKCHDNPSFHIWCGDESRHDKPLGGNELVIKQSKNFSFVKFIINFFVIIKLRLTFLLIKMRFVKVNSNNEKSAEQADVSHTPDARVIINH